MGEVLNFFREREKCPLPLAQFRLVPLGILPTR